MHPTQPHPRRFSRIRRRSVLKGLGGITIGLPLLESMAHAGGASPPKRLVIFTTTNGFDPLSVWPTGSETNFTLGENMAPLQPYADRLILFRGIDNMAAMASPTGNGHTEGVRCMLTGRTGTSNDSSDYAGAGGISIDQFVANQISDGLPLKSIELLTGAWAESYPAWTSFSAANQPVPFEQRTDVIWNRIFDGVDPSAGPSPAMQQLQANRKSVLDAVAEQYAGLKVSLSAADRQRLDAHLQRVRELEERVSSAHVAAECVVPPEPPPNGPMDGSDDVGTDLIAHALGCDLLRVATVGMRNSMNQFAPNGTSYHDDHLHYVAGGDPATRAIVNNAKQWQAQRLVHLLDTLAAMPEGTGSVLDNTLVIWADEFCHGYSHQHHEIPYVLISGSDRFFEMGRYIQYASPRANNELWLSVRDAMDCVGDFGDPQFGNTPLPNLA